MSLLSIATTYAARKLQERTTWLGIASAVAAYFGHKLPPELAEAITTAAIGLTSLALVIINERHHGPGAQPPVSQPSRADGAPVDGTVKAAPTAPVAPEITVRGPDGLTRHVHLTGD